MAYPGGTISRDEWCCDAPDLPSGCGVGNPHQHAACVCKNCGARWWHMLDQVAREVEEGSELKPLLLIEGD